MAEIKNVKVNGTVGSVDLLQLMFIYLKLTGVIAWSWIWVLSPMWIVVVAAILAYIFGKAVGA